MRRRLRKPWWMVLLLVLALSGSAEAQDRVIALMEKVDKRIDLLDDKITKFEARLQALESKYGSYSPTVTTTPVYKPEPPVYRPDPTPVYKASYTPSTPPERKVTRQEWRDSEYSGVNIVIGPPPWAFPDGPPPGLIPIGPPFGPPGGASFSFGRPPFGH